MPIPCPKCGRKNLRKSDFLTIVLYPCKCGNVTLGFDTNVKELTKIADKEEHPLYSHLTVNEIVQILLQETERNNSERKEQDNKKNT
jgi:hypothetical protein